MRDVPIAFDALTDRILAFGPSKKNAGKATKQRKLRARKKQQKPHAKRASSG